MTFPDAVANVFDHYEAHGAAILRMLSQEDRIPAIHDLIDRGQGLPPRLGKQSLQATPRGPSCARPESAGSPPS